MTNIGTLVMMKIGTLILVGESTTSFKSAQAMIEISNKTSGNVAAFVGGRITQTMNVTSIASTNPAASGYGFAAALAAQAAGTPVAATITEYTDATGTTAFTGASKLTANCLFADVALDIPDNAKMTFSLSLQITGGTTVSTN